MRRKAPRGEGPEPPRPWEPALGTALRRGRGRSGPANPPQPGGPALPGSPGRVVFLCQTCPKQFQAGGAAAPSAALSVGTRGCPAGAVPEPRAGTQRGWYPC